MERRTQKDAQELKVLATKPKNVSLLSGIHMVEYIFYIYIYGKQSKKVANTNLWPPHTHTRV